MPSVSYRMVPGMNELSGMDLLGYGHRLTSWTRDAGGSVGLRIMDELDHGCWWIGWVKDNGRAGPEMLVDWMGDG